MYSDTNERNGCLSEVEGATQKANKCLSYLFYY
jgi:hypothetical protein